MKRMDYKKIGNNLRLIREYFNLTQEQVANILKIGRDAIIRIEKGTRKITAEELLNFSKLYSVKIEEIIGDSENDQCSERVFARKSDKQSKKDNREIRALIRLSKRINSKLEVNCIDC